MNIEWAGACNLKIMIFSMSLASCVLWLRIHYLALSVHGRRFNPYIFSIYK
jgi:hypothetical protein